MDGVLHREPHAVDSAMPTRSRSSDVRWVELWSRTRFARWIAARPAVGTIRDLGFARISSLKKSSRRTSCKTIGLGASAVKEQGREMVHKRFRLLDQDLACTQFAAEDGFSIADAALFYVERWAPQTDIKLSSHVALHFERMKERPSVRKVMANWGEM